MNNNEMLYRFMKTYTYNVLEKVHMINDSLPEFIASYPENIRHEFDNANMFLVTAIVTSNNMILAGIDDDINKLAFPYKLYCGKYDKMIGKMLGLFFTEDNELARMNIDISLCHVKPLDIIKSKYDIPEADMKNIPKKFTKMDNAISLIFWCDVYESYARNLFPWNYSENWYSIDKLMNNIDDKYKPALDKILSIISKRVTKQQNDKYQLSELLGVPKELLL